MHSRRPRIIVNSAAAAVFLGMPFGAVAAVGGLVIILGLRVMVCTKLVQSHIKLV